MRDHWLREETGRVEGVGVGTREWLGYTHDGSEEVHHRILIPTATSGCSRSLGGGGQTTEGALRQTGSTITLSQFQWYGWAGT